MKNAENRQHEQVKCAYTHTHKHTHSDCITFCDVTINMVVRGVVCVKRNTFSLSRRRLHDL